MCAGSPKLQEYLQCWYSQIIHEGPLYFVAVNIQIFFIKFNYEKATKWSKAFLLGKNLKTRRGGPADNRASTNQLSPFLFFVVVLHDTWHMISDMWHLTCYTWHVTMDTYGIVNTMWKLQVSSSYGLEEAVKDMLHLTHDIWHMPGGF